MTQGGDIVRKVMAYVHSLKDLQTDANHMAEVAIISKDGDNNIVVEYKGKKCTAIYNIFAGAYFVDDVYGVIGGGR